MFDIMMIAKCRATRITHMFSNKDGVPHYQRNAATSQRYSKGNVAIFAQDVATVRSVLPPPRSEISEAMCALFIGSDTIPTRDNIRNLGPVLVSKTRVEKLIKFLLEENAFYSAADLTFSQDNLNSLFGPEWGDNGVPSGVELCCLPDASAAPAASYADRGDQPLRRVSAAERQNGLVMEAVGYTVGDRSPEDYRKMKASAVAWCLDKKTFVQMQTTSKFMTDNDPGLLTYTFPNLDPWGIGGFHEPNRTPQQNISFERQVKNLLLQHDGLFQKDPNFAYVCWNIMQKKEKWELNPKAKASNKAEKKALRTLSKLRLVAKDLKGSSGYKQCRRNEIRAMMKKMATPALFLTLNPADIIDPLLGAMAGIAPEVWAAMTSFQRHRFVARNPGPAAMFFDEVIKNFIRIILKYVRSMLRVLWDCRSARSRDTPLPYVDLD
ncbi:hypothetical protein C8R44DRAFT_830719 [Mycena epipterygia]|nr:hypothetical protein C8R44DRAFT_830719 [Mycena epipterygia]